HKEMKTKPIKRNENLVPISREHHATLLFCWKLRNGVKMEIVPERIALYVAWFWISHLQPHFNKEEKLLFKDCEHTMVNKAVQQQTDMYKKVIENESLGAAKPYEAILQLAYMDDQHTRYEERELFPWIENTLSENSLKTIGIELLHEEHTAVENYV